MYFRLAQEVIGLTKTVVRFRLDSAQIKRKLLDWFPSTIDRRDDLERRDDCKLVGNDRLHCTETASIVYSQIVYSQSVHW